MFSRTRSKEYGKSTRFRPRVLLELFLSASAFALKESSSSGLKNRISGRIISSAFDDSVEAIKIKYFAKNVATRLHFLFWRYYTLALASVGVFLISAESAAIRVRRASSGSLKYKGCRPMIAG